MGIQNTGGQNMDKNLPAVLLLDLSAAGVAVARILTRHGVEVYGAEAREDMIGNYSRYIKRPAFGFKIELNDRFLDNLKQFSRNFAKKPILIPADDVYIEFLGKHFDILKEYFIMQDSLSPDCSYHFLNKKAFYRLCLKHEVPCPRSLILSGNESIEDIIGTLRFPIILKPDLMHKWRKYLGGNKVILINSVEELKDIFASHKPIMSNSMFQEVIPGDENNIYFFKGYFDKDGRLLDSFTGRKIRQYPPNFGSTTMAESVFNKDIEELSIKFLHAVNFYGLCGTEFKYDARDSEYKMIEVNIRPELWEDITRIAEKEITWTAYLDLAGFSIPEPNTQKNGLKWIYLTRDIFSALWHVRNSNLKIQDWMQSYKGTKSDALIDFKDLRMLLYLPIYTFSQIYKYKIKSWIQGSHIEE